jgi:hypothetical protein
MPREDLGDGLLLCGIEAEFASQMVHHVVSLRRH